MTSHRVVALAAPLLAAALVLTACTTGSFAGGGSSAGATGAASSKPSASAAPSAAAATGSVSTDGVCGLLPIAKVDSTLKRSYTDSKEIQIPSISIEDASYCLYGTSALAGQFAIQVVTSDPATAYERFNDAVGDTFAPLSGIGDSASYSAGSPELLVVWGQTTVVVGQATFSKGDAVITQGELEKLANAVHTAL